MGALRRLVWSVVFVALASACDTRRCLEVAASVRSGDDAAAIAAIGRSVPRCRLGPEGYTLLHEAAVAGRVAVIAALLDHGMAVDVPSRVRKTAFYEACKHGQLAAAEVLLDRGAALDAPNGEIGARPMWVAAERKNADIVTMLLDRGADVDARNVFDQTALIQAARQAWHHDDAIARILVAHGASLEVHDNFGWTPLGTAAKACNVPVVAFLVERGANVDAHLDDGSTPLDLARQFRCPAAAQLLREHGAHSASDR